MKKKLIIIILAIIIAVGGSVFYYNHAINSATGTDETVVVTVDAGDTCHKMITKLSQSGLIESTLAAKVYVKFHPTTLKANTYKLNKNMNFKQMLAIMHTANTKYVVNNKLTVKEGTTLSQIAIDVAACLTKIQKKTVTPEEVLKQWSDTNYLNTLMSKYWFIKADTQKAGIKYPLEGYFYPETYYINEKNATLDTITTKLLDAMNTKLTPYQSSMTALNYTPHQFLTLSSIVERESLFDADRPKIAGVFMNRLKKNMYLQSDVTVNYALGRTGVKVSHKMLKTKSPYNTYLHKGLPIGPVATVSQKTLEAVAHYTPSDYYYFFAKKDGTVIYSKTYKEHQKAVKENKWY
ncbi:MAG TPA: endolytic transglycosylase MltG [Erysipelotrichaceae bacterium]|nr:endolytic transglycosylase MltG [Erysipelotrichaceae bacterium]